MSSKKTAAKKVVCEMEVTPISPPLTLYALRHKESGNFLYARTNDDYTMRSGYGDITVYYLDKRSWRGRLWVTDMYKQARIVCTTHNLEELGLCGWEWPSHRFDPDDLEIVMLSCNCSEYFGNSGSMPGRS